MKVVRGTSREYQLVDKTKRKDLDGVIYLVAGQSRLWVKLLKDRSEKKRQEIQTLIRLDASSGFEKPLEIVYDNRGFAGYTFLGQTMQVVPVKPPADNKKSFQTAPNPEKSAQFQGSFRPMDQPFAGTAINNNRSTRTAMSSGLQMLLLVLLGAALIALTLLVLDKWLVRMIYTHISQVAGEGCSILSIKGTLPAVVGAGAMIWYRKSFGEKIETVPLFLAFAALAYAAGVIATYGIIGVMCVLVIGIFGVVKAYQSVIITVIVLIILARMFLKK